MLVNFEVTKEERAIIYKIAKRASEMAHSQGWRYELLTAEIDLCACHANGNPIKLQSLLYADDMNFAHDVFGIRRHIDRDTGDLKDFFVPRYSGIETEADRKAVAKEVVNILKKIKAQIEKE